MERGGDEFYEYKKALKKAKEAIETICDLSEEMEDKYSERGGMHGSYRDDEEYEMKERRRYR